MLQKKNQNDIRDKNIKIDSLLKIIENISDGIVMSDCNGKIIIYNSAMEKLEDRKSVDMIGKYLWDAYEYAEEDSSEHRKVFETGNPIINAYSAHTYNNHIPKYVSYSTYPLIKDGEKIGVYSICKNETKLHKLLAETMELKRNFNNKANNAENRTYKSNGTTYTFSDLIGSSQEMLKLIKEAQAIAWLENNILIVGNTGTGKEMFAQSIHNYGKRCEEPFIGINCSAIPENLLESILFGTMKGAFTGAIESKGLFIEAKGGTLFLDELNSMPTSMQTKLLRVIQERRVMPLGGDRTFPINCRIISAMNEEPSVLIRNGRLREDLFYRIAGFSLYIPPLRDRAKDIFDLSDFFISEFNVSMDKNILGLSKELKKLISQYNWPGNIRELRHLIENMMVRVEENADYLRISNIPEYLREKIIGDNAINDINEEKESLTGTLSNVEKRIIEETLNKNNWNISQSSRELGIIRQSLLYRIKKLGIKKPTII